MEIRVVSETDDKIYIFMEYCNGGSLQELFKLKKGKFSQKLIHHIIRSTVNGYSNMILDHHIVHRNLNLSNIYIHFTDHTTYLMDLTPKEKTKFIENFDLDQTQNIKIKISGFKFAR